MTHKLNNITINYQEIFNLDENRKQLMVSYQLLVMDNHDKWYYMYQNFEEMKTACNSNNVAEFIEKNNIPLHEWINRTPVDRTHVYFNDKRVDLIRNPVRSDTPKYPDDQIMVNGLFLGPFKYQGTKAEFCTELDPIFADMYGKHEDHSESYEQYVEYILDKHLYPATMAELVECKRITATSHLFK
jgi:hypothetical protein